MLYVIHAAYTRVPLAYLVSIFALFQLTLLFRDCSLLCSFLGHISWHITACLPCSNLFTLFKLAYLVPASLPCSSLPTLFQPGYVNCSNLLTFVPTYSPYSSCVPVCPLCSNFLALRILTFDSETYCTGKDCRREYWIRRVVVGPGYICGTEGSFSYRFPGYGCERCYHALNLRGL